MMEKTGLWKLRKSLVIDPATASFPMRCVFTNEPVAELTHMKLAHVQKKRYQAIVRKEKMVLMPISNTWRRRQNVRAKWISLGLILLGLVIVTLGILIPLLMGMQGEERLTAIGVTVSIGLLSLVIGPFIPLLDDFNGSNSVYGVTFMKDGRLVVPKVHPALLEGLPELEYGHLHGVFGIEAIREPEA